MSRGFSSNYRVVLLALAMFAGFVGVGARLVELQYVGRAELIQAAIRARQQITVRPARRGDIRDARGDMLATTQPEYQFGVDPQVAVETDNDRLPELARLLGISLDEVTRLVQTKTRPGVRSEARVVTVNASALPRIQLPALGSEPAGPAGGVVGTPGNSDQAQPIRWAPLGEPVVKSTYDQVMALGIKGVYANLRHRRVYPQGELASHLVGYVNKSDLAPVTGLEAEYDFYLRGQDGWYEGERDGRRRELAQFRTRDVAPYNGDSLTLSLDSAVQQMIEDELRTLAMTYTPAGATIIVSDARTGFLLGLGNYPTFDPNAYNEVPESKWGSLRNRAVTDQLDPGSTFKIVATAAALNEGLVTPDTLIDVSQTDVLIKGSRVPFMADDHAMPKQLPVSGVISHSSNVGAAQIGLLLGPERLYAYARAFGFGESSGLGFGGEISGVLRTPDNWHGTDYTRIPAGYSVSATPLQIHYAMGVIASGGWLFQPQLVLEIDDANGAEVHRFEPRQKRQVISAAAARAMAQMLMGVASADGTAPKAEIEDFQVAGKTGTAQKYENGRYSDRNHIASFSGFFPASDPRVVVTVIVDSAQVPGGGTAYGGVVAAPSFRRLAMRLISYLDIPEVTNWPRLAQSLPVQPGGLQ